VVSATAHADSGRRGDCMRVFLRELHRELVDADDRLQRCQAVAIRPRRVALVG
jgi:hypothetical protein